MMRRWAALIKRVDVFAPLLQRRQPLFARTIGIGDVVSLSAKTVDLEHRLPLLLRKVTHRGVE